MKISLTKKISEPVPIKITPRRHPNNNQAEPETIPTWLYLKMVKCILVIAGLYIRGCTNSNILIVSVTDTAAPKNNNPPDIDRNQNGRRIERNVIPIASALNLGTSLARIL